MNINAVKTAYRRYAHIYDFVFGPVFHPGRREVVDALDCQPGMRVLEVGVGTGLSLPLYPDYVRVSGIDVSREMLAKAERRVQRHDLKQVEAVLEMDGEQMQFPDNSFDKVVAMYVVSVVPNPDKLIDEMRRVCKPDGDIYIVNHFRSGHPLIERSERLLSPLSGFAGFRTDMDLDTLVEQTGLDVVDRRNVNVFGYWKVLRCRNTPRQSMVA